MRRSEKEIRNEKELLDLLDRGKHLTLAMCKDGQPYLVTVNHALDRKARCLYFHCAQEGRKIDFLKANPQVWGQVLDDRGYIDGECDYAYATVMFGGKVEFVTDVREKRRALVSMIDKLDSKPESTKKTLIVPASLQGVLICRIRIESLSGKMGGAPVKKANA